MTYLEIFTLAQASNSIGVMNVTSDAADNAAATIGSRFVRGNFDVEFLGYWFNSVLTILECGDDVAPDARAFFELLGVGV